MREVGDSPRAQEGGSDWRKKLSRSMETANFPSLYHLLAKARNDYGVKVCACSFSFRLLKLDAGEATNRVDEIIGLSTMLQIASQTKHVMYI